MEQDNNIITASIEAESVSAHTKEKKVSGFKKRFGKKKRKSATQINESNNGVNQIDGTYEAAGEGDVTTDASASGNLPASRFLSALKYHYCGSIARSNHKLSCFKKYFLIACSFNPSPITMITSCPFSIGFMVIPLCVAFSCIQLPSAKNLLHGIPRRIPCHSSVFPQ
jgi:hypothetical protein